MTSSKRRPRGRRGAAAAELALLLPPLCYMGVAAVDFARVYQVAARASECARSGAVYASQIAGDGSLSSSDQANVTAVAAETAGGASSAPTIAIRTGSDSAGGSYVEVQASATFRTLSTYPGIASQTSIVRTVRMRRRPA